MNQTSCATWVSLNELTREMDTCQYYYGVGLALWETKD
jgi:hypothetical protein